MHHVVYVCHVLSKTQSRGGNGDFLLPVSLPFCPGQPYHETRWSLAGAIVEDRSRGFCFVLGTEKVAVVSVGGCRWNGVARGDDEDYAAVPKIIAHHVNHVVGVGHLLSDLYEGDGVESDEVRKVHLCPLWTRGSMNRTGLFITTGLLTGLIVGLLALVGAPTWALIASAFGFSFLLWDYFDGQSD